jgi:branched-chain amino acid transport system permease protein
MRGGGNPMVELIVFVQQVVNGLISGGLYALLAIGLSLTFGVLGIINFAHGEIFAVGAYLAFFAWSVLHLPPPLALALAVAGTAVLGVLAERVVFRPLRFTDPLNSMIAAIGLSFLLQNVLLQSGGAEPRRLDPFLRGVLFLGPIALPMQHLAILVLSALLIAGIELYLARTWNGLALRASAQDLDTAALMGVTGDRLAAVTFAAASALAAGAGVLVGSVFLIEPTMGTLAVVKGFVVVILGGVGNTAGVILGGLLLGVTESLTVAYVSTALRDIVSFAVLILALLVRPQGLLRGS